MIDPLPKMPIGSLHLEFKTCGRLGCHCHDGMLHGPYVYRRWREGGRQRKAYVPMNRLADVHLAMERERLLVARPRMVVQLLRAGHAC